MTIDTPVSIVESVEDTSSSHMSIEEIRQGVILLESLTSQSLSALQNHDGDTTLLEALYEDAPTNYAQLLEARTEVIQQLNTYMSEQGISKRDQDSIRETRASSDATFEQDLENTLRPLGLNSETKQEISRLAEQIQKLTQDLATVHRFQTIYSSIEDIFCTQDDEANPYIRGTFTYTKTKVSKEDMCVNSNQNVRQYICQGGQEADISPTITPCTYGCLHGACIAAIITDARIIQDASGKAKTQIPAQTDFWIQLATSSDEKWVPDLSYEIASKAFEDDTCTLDSTQDQIGLGEENIQLIGPISCSQWGKKEIRVRLQNGHGVSDFRDLQIDITD